jgi:aspartyl protease family protein
MNPAPDPTHTPAKLGRGMLIGGWVLGLLLLVLLFGKVLDHNRNPNRSVAGAVTESGVREVVLERNRSGHYLAGGRIDGQAVEFLLDTGASDVSVPEEVARRLGLKYGAPLLYSTANGNITAYNTRLPSLSIGTIELHDVRASINPHMGGETILLGMSFLKHLEFTQRGDTLIIRQYPQQ